MKKLIVAFTVLFVGVGVLTFLLLRAQRTIQQQQRSLSELSAKVERLERASTASAASVQNLTGELLRPRITPSSAPVQNMMRELFELQQSIQRKVSPQYYDTPDFELPKDRVAPPPQSAQVPPGGVPFQFNGATYYCVPLAMKK